MTNRPCVSICIPTYNGREHLGECIASIRSQTFADFEVVICDDESSDGTLDLAQQLAAGDPRFRFISNSRRFGLVGNWNNCVQQARGEWIKFVFQDDVIFPACVEKLLGACRREEKSFGFCERDFIFGDAVSPALRDWFAGHKQRLRSDYAAGSVISPDTVARLALQHPAHNLVGEPTVTMIHHSVFKELGGYDEALIQLCDAEFWCRVMLNRGAVFIPESLAAFRIHAKATTALNHGKRVFRMDVLDPLVLRYRFAFGPEFRPLRNSHLSGRSTFSVRREFAAAAVNAWRQAQTAEKAGDHSFMAEWQTVKSHCPRLQTMVWLGRGFKFLARIKRGIARRLK